MSACKLCGSYAINPDKRGRDPTQDLDLCDICYWKVRAERMIAAAQDLLDSGPDRIGIKHRVDTCYHGLFVWESCDGCHDMAIRKMLDNREGK